MAGLMATCGAANAAQLQEQRQLNRFFAAHDIAGVMVVGSGPGKPAITSDARRAVKRYTPASTFKIANSLIALETGAVPNVDTVIPYGGKAQIVKRWERDMSLRDAIRVSNVPVYQTLARRIGLPAYRRWLTRLDYGNRKVGTNVDRFWLDGPLATSAVEQVRFIDALARGNLPVSARSRRQVREILRHESRSGRTLYAKTGWCGSCTPGIGWWTGWVEGPSGTPITPFSLNMDMPLLRLAPLRLSIAKAILAHLKRY